MQNKKMAAFGGVLVACSLAGAQPFNALHFDLNQLQSQFFDAPGGAAGGGSIVPTLEPLGGSAAGGASPFTGSIQFSVTSTSSLSPATGNSVGSLSGPFSFAGMPGTLSSVGGFLNVSAGLVTNGEIEFTNTIGDSLVASVNIPGGAPIGFLVGSYFLSAPIKNVSFIDAGGDGFFGDPGTGVDITEFLATGSAFGDFLIPIMGANGLPTEWDIFITVPGPASPMAMGLGALFFAVRRRR